MSTTELLRRQVQEYVSVASEKSLRIVQAILEIEEEEDWWDTLPESVQRSIEKGIKESDEGNVIPHEEVMKSIKDKAVMAELERRSQEFRECKVKGVPWDTARKQILGIE